MDTTIADPRIGVLLEQRYRVVARIAQGGMASVYEAHDIRLDRAVAVKIMHTPYADDPAFVRRFIAEAKSAAAINHPNIVAVYDQGTDDNLTFLVMELVDGHTLRDVLAERGRLTPAETTTVLEPVLEALAAAHRNNLVHRDVKPENVLISSAGQIKVADFGLARAVEASGKLNTTKGVVMGTVAYVSPEQIMNGESDTRSDVYAAGIMAFEMLAGSPPFNGASAVNVAFQHVHSEVPAPSNQVANIPPELDELVVAATRKDRDERPTDASALLEQLRSVNAAAGLHAVPIPVPAGSRVASKVELASTTMLPADNDRTNLLPAAREPDLAEAPTQVITTVRSNRPFDRHGEHTSRRGRHGVQKTKTPLLIGGIVVLALLAGLIGWWLVSPGTTLTPSVVNMSKEDAQTEADKVGLDLRFGEPQYSETVRAGTIVSQDPAANSEIDEGGTITVVLSKGPERKKVPDLTGQTEDQAEKTLDGSGFKSKVVREYNDDIDKGKVIKTEPGQGTEVKPGEYVTIVVSKGDKPLDVPNVVGQQQDAAKAALEGLGLVVNITKDTTGAGQPGEVLAQDPGPGETINKGDTVTITVSDALTMPDVVGLKYDEAEAQLRAMGLRVNKGSGRRDDVVFAQDPTAGAPVKAGDRVTLWAL